MHRNLTVEDNNTIIFHLGNEIAKNKWNDLFISENGMISHLIIPSNIAVDYKVNNIDGLYDVILHNEQDFIYSDAEKILDRMYNNNIGEIAWYNDGYKEAFNKLVANDRIFLPSNNPLFAIYFHQDNLILKLVGIDNIKNNTLIFNFIRKVNLLLSSRDDVVHCIHSVKIEICSNYVILHGFASLDNFLSFLINILESLMTITECAKENWKRISLVNFLNNEIRNLKIVAQHPSTHPLFKYKAVVIILIDVFKSMQKIGIDKLSKNNFSVLSDALHGIGIFENTPPIIMRSVIKLRYRFTDLLVKIIKN